MSIRKVILVIALVGLLGVAALAFLYFGPGSSTRTDPLFPNVEFSELRLEGRAERRAENKRRIGRIGDIEKRGARVSDVRELASFLDPAVPLFDAYGATDPPLEKHAQFEARRVLKSLGDDARPELLKVVKDASLPAMQRAKTLGFLRQDSDLALFEVFEEVLAMPDGKFISVLSWHASPNVPKPDLDEFTQWFEANKHRYVFDTKEYRFRLTDVKNDQKPEPKK
ncbi:MAG: hypothetical protein H8E73_09165 [Planctomycetes bacterium]|nr:hypothetical protein [Planctomycetota bacterium]